MEKIIITTKKAKNQDGNCFIKILKNVANICYSYYDGKYSIDEPKKSTFNKFSFIEYLKNIKVQKKYIKEVEEL